MKKKKSEPIEPKIATIIIKICQNVDEKTEIRHSVDGEVTTLQAIGAVQVVLHQMLSVATPIK